MQIISNIEHLSKVGPTIVTVGSFDGVHCGHRSLIESLTSRAKKQGFKSVVVSFNPHPRIALNPSSDIKLLSSDTEKRELLSSLGVDILLLLEFNKSFSRLAYEQFIEEYLIIGANMKELVVGFNHQMGHNNGNYKSIVECAKRLNFEVTMAEEYCAEQCEKVSSTQIRSLISEGEMPLANQLLGYNYLVMGDVQSDGRVHRDEPRKLLPSAGQYRAIVNGSEQIITIDTKGNVECQQRYQRVKIEIIERYETK